jgi:ABC-2 type transport system permease protein
MKTFFQLYLSNLREFSRNRLAMFWSVAFPVLFILLFGTTFSGTSDTTFNIGVAVGDSGKIGPALAQAFDGVQAFRITRGKTADLLAELQQGKLSAVIVIPEGVSAAVLTGKDANVEVHYDPSNQTASQVVLTIVEKVVGGFEQSLTRQPALLVIQPVTTTGSSLRTVDFLLPGILAMALMQLGVMATAPPLVQLREQQILRRLGATPLSRSMLLAAQVCLRLTIGLTQTVLLILVGSLLFHVHIIGNWFVLAAFVVLGALMFVSLGYLMSGLAKTQDSVTGLSQLVNFPMMFLSGLFFPVDMMPAWIRPVIDAMPLTYLADGLRQIMVGAIPVHPLRIDLIVLAAWLAVCAVLAVRFFRWE